jgi:hypothetical protein
MSAPDVFLSYAREDATAARHIAQIMRATGVEVWIDQNKLVGGDAWDSRLRRAVWGSEFWVLGLEGNSNE